VNVAEKAQGQMKLLFRNPAQTANMRIEGKKRYLAASRKSETDKEPFRAEHTLMIQQLIRNRQIALAARQPHPQSPRGDLVHRVISRRYASYL